MHANIWYFMSSLIYKVGFCFANLFPQKCLLLSTCYCGLTSLLNVRCCFPTFHSGFKKLHIKCTRTWSVDIFYCFSVLPLAINAALPVRPSVRLSITLFCQNWLITGSINTLKWRSPFFVEDCYAQNVVNATFLSPKWGILKFFLSLHVRFF